MDHKLQALRLFFPLFTSLPCPLDEPANFPFALSWASPESVEFSFSSVSFTFDEPDFNLPLPLILDLLPLLEVLPLALEVTFSVSCLDFTVFRVSCLDLVALGVLVPSSFDLLILDVPASSCLDLLAVFAPPSVGLLPLLEVWSLVLPLLSSPIFLAAFDSSTDLPSVLPTSFDFRPDLEAALLDLLEEDPPLLPRKY